jgi:hypothetical protein
MQSHVDLQPTGSGVPLVAPWDLTHEWLLASVGQLVSLEMAFGDEFLFALLALKRSFTGMSPHVSFQVACFCEFFQTFLKRTK